MKAKKPLAKSPKYLPYIVFAFAFLIYANSIGNQYALDDDFVTRQNFLVQKGLSGIGEIFSHGFFYGFNGRNDQAYRPFTVATFAVEKHFFENNPAVSHFFNVLLYAILVLVLFKLLNEMFRNYHYSIPFIISLLFAAHPAHTEVVANIKSRDEILSLLFSVISLFLLVNYIKKDKIKFLYSAFACYFLSLLSKESSFTIALVIPFFIIGFTSFPVKKNIYISAAYIGIVGLYIFIRSSVLDAFTFDEKVTVINNSLAAAGSTPELFATKFILLIKYIYLLIIPYPLSSDYSYNQIPVTDFSNPLVILSVLIHLALFGYMAYALKKRDPVGFGILFYFATLSVSSNFFFLIGSTFAERFLFSPSLGFAIAIVLIMDRLLKITKQNRFPGRLFMLFIPVLVVFTALTINRNRAWYDNFSLFSADIGTSPNSARMHFMMGTAWRDKALASKSPEARLENLKKSIEEFNKCAEIYPAYISVHYNTGVSYYEMGEKSKSLEAYYLEKKHTPDFRDLNNNIGVLYFEQGKMDSAKYYFEEELKLDSNSGKAVANLGAVYHSLGDYVSAIPYYERAIKLDPENINTYNNIIRIFESLGNTTKAEEYKTLRQNKLRRQ